MILQYVVVRRSSSSTTVVWKKAKGHLWFHYLRMHQRALQRFISSAALTVLFCASFSSCKKADEHKQAAIFSIDAIHARFFSGTAQDIRVNAIKQKIYREEQAQPFIANYIKWAGFPNWDKALTGSRHAAAARNTQAENSNYDVVFIPFTQDSSNAIAAILLAIITPRDTIFKTMYRWQYKQLPYKTATCAGPTAEKMATLFMGFEHYAFGHTWFDITDSLLFRGERRSLSHAKLRISDFSFDRANALVMEGCHIVYAVGSNGQVVGAAPDGPDPNLGALNIQCDHIDFSDEASGEGGSGFPGMVGNGSGSNGGGWNDNPCRSVAAAGNNPCDGNGNNTGWQPSTGPILTLSSVADSLTHPCLITALNKITNTELHNFVTNLYYNTFIAQPIDIVFKEDTALRDLNNQPQESQSAPDTSRQTWYVLLNTNFFNGHFTDSVSQEYTSQVILHEIIHSFIYIYRADLGIGAVNQISAHKAIFTGWIEQMRDALKSAYPNLRTQDATALALSGIDDILRPEYDTAGTVSSYDTLMNNLAVQEYGIDLLTAGTITYQYRHGVKGTKCN